MKVLGLIVVFILIIWLAGKFYSWDEKKNNGFGCAMITMFGVILMFLLGAVSTCKSCVSESSHGPSYDYYDDRAR